ncbi:MAG: hypothetical protein MJB57_12320 [Gemmatimonadetes bacterium]|nr:hypothetical protein [Gemmatimonadota bacterium]
MILYLATWIVLVPSLLLIGLAVPEARQLPHRGDRFVVAVWIGLALASILALGLSLFLPLTPTVCGIAILAVAGACASRRPVRKALVQLLPDRAVAASSSVVALAAAAFAAQRHLAGDLGLYHYQAIRWFHEYGAVPGLALIHVRLGSASGWLALHSPFDSGVLLARADAVFGGLVVALAVFHAAVVLARLLRGHRRFEDMFALVAYVCLSPFMADEHMVSTHAETPISLLIVAMVYVVLHVDRVRREGTTEGEVSPSARTIVILLAAGVAGWKLHAIALLPVAVLYYASSGLGSREYVMKLLVGSGLAALLVLPMIAFNVVASGCPLYPANLCLPVDWAVDPAHSNYGELLQTVTRWGGASTPVDAGPLDWLIDRVRAFPALQVSIVGSIVVFSVPRARIGGGARWAVAMAGAGIAITLYGAPIDRFLRPYVYVIPSIVFALGAAAISARLENSGRDRIPWIRKRLTHTKSIVACTLAGALFLLTSQPIVNPGALLRGDLRRVVRLERIGWLRPDAIPEVPVAADSAGNLRYFRPRLDGRCWASPLPCTPSLQQPNVELRDPERGLAGGFRGGLE